MGIALGVQFSSSAADIVFEGVLNCELLFLSVFCGISFCVLFKSSIKVVVVWDLEDSVEEMGEKGFLFMGDSTSRAFTALREWFLSGKPAIFEFLPPKTMKWKIIWKVFFDMSNQKVFLDDARNKMLLKALRVVLLLGKW